MTTLRAHASRAVLEAFTPDKPETEFVLANRTELFVSSITGQLLRAKFPLRITFLGNLPFSPLVNEKSKGIEDNSIYEFA